MFSSLVNSLVRILYQSSPLFFKMGSVVITPFSSTIRLSTTLRYSAKYCSTGARFISSKQRKYGTSRFSHALATNFRKSPATNTGLPLTRLTYPISSLESCQFGFTWTISKFFGFCATYSSEPSSQQALANSRTILLFPVPEIPARSKNGLDLMAVM